MCYNVSFTDTQVVHPQSQIALPPSNIIVNHGDNANFQCITEGRYVSDSETQCGFNMCDNNAVPYPPLHGVGLYKETTVY